MMSQPDAEIVDPRQSPGLSVKNEPQTHFTPFVLPVKIFFVFFKSRPNPTISLVFNVKELG